LASKDRLKYWLNETAKIKRKKKKPNSAQFQTFSSVTGSPLIKELSEEGAGRNCRTQLWSKLNMLVQQTQSIVTRYFAS